MPKPQVKKLLLVHAAWHGAWVWDRLLDPLRHLGLHPETIDLPGHGNSQDEFTDLHGDAEAVASRLNQMDGPTLLVGHSYGGMVITEAGTHEAVGGLAYVSAFLPLDGETLTTAGTQGAADDEPISALIPCTKKVGDGSLLTLEGDEVAQVVYGDIDPALQRWAMDRIGLQPTVTFQQAPSRLAWRVRPTTFILCTRDRSNPPPRQRRMAAHADHVMELETGHSPQLSAPEALAQLLYDVTLGL